MVQLAEGIGERGVTFLMALSAGLLAGGVAALRAKRPRLAVLKLVSAALLPLLMFLEGRARILGMEAKRREAPVAHVALIQPSVDAHDRWNGALSGTILDKLTRATAHAEHSGAELTVWPEAAYPYLVGHLTRRCPVGSLAMLPYGVRGPVLAGLVMTGANGDVLNSAAVCQTDGTLSKPQDKMRLLWFGETIPWLDRIPWVRARFTRGVGLVAGEEVVLQRAGKVRAAVLNCFEDTLPDAGREAMAARPNLLVNMTNDAWFAGSAESELHLRLAVLRAVESRRDLVRAVNEGVTSWVDAAGVVRARTEGPLRNVLMADAALLETSETPFDRFGDWPLAALLAASVGLGFWRTRRA
jgi:apolipoprotein N-acyltransferase